MDAELIKLEWPQPEAPHAPLSFYKNSQTIKGFGGTPLRYHKRHKTYIPFQNWQSAQIQEEDIHQILAPAPGKDEIQQVEIPTPKQEIELKERQKVEEEENSSKQKLEAEKKIRNIIDQL